MMPDVDGIAATNLTEKSFTVNFPATDGITNYDTGLTTFTTPVSSTGIQAAGSKDFANLQPATRYQFFLKNADCGSGWATPKSIWTAALPPYSYGFESTKENYGEYDSDGWTSTSWINGSGSSAQDGSGYVFSNTSTSYAKNDWLYSYPIKLQANEQISIKYYAKMSTDAATPSILKLVASSSTEKRSHLAEISSNVISGTAYREYTATYTAPSTGVYYFGFGNVNPKVAAAGTIRLDTVSFTSGTLGTADYSAQDTTVIYPVPVKDILNIKTADKVTGVEIYDAAGRIVKNMGSVNAIDTSSLTKGVYIIKIKTSAGIVTKKFTK